MIALWMIYTTLISGLLSLAALAAERALRLYGGATRWLWAAAIATGISVPVALRLVPALIERGAPAAAAPPPEGFAPVLLDPLVIAFSQPAPLFERLDGPLMALWALMTVALAISLAGGAAHLARQRRRWTSRPLEGDRVLVSDGFGPAVVGLRRPEIVLPEWTLGMSGPDLHLVLLHEREHRRARDTQLLMAGLFAMLAMPWNVPLWWQFKRLRAAVELDCDARVIRSGVPGTTYGALLVRMSEQLKGMGLAVASLTEPRSLLEGRIRMMVERKPKGRFARAVVAAGLTITVLAVACETPTPAVLVDELEDAAATEAAAVAAAKQEDAAQETKFLTASEMEPGEPLVIIDGKIVQSGTLAELNPSTIESIDVLKGAAATEAYGDEGVHGVIRIFLKRVIATPTGPEELTERLDAAARTLHESLRNESSPQTAEFSEITVTERQPAPVARSVSDAPVFTPMTVRPEIKNKGEVIVAMEREYPKILRDAGMGGRVILWFFITETGEVADVRVARTSGYPALDDAAVRVGQVYRFEPARNRDEPVPVWVQFPLTFEVR